MRGVVSRALHERRYTAGSLNARSAVSTSGDMDAIQLRDEVVELKKLMNAVIKERDLAKMQQVDTYMNNFSVHKVHACTWCIHICKG